VERDVRHHLVLRPRLAAAGDNTQEHALITGLLLAAPTRHSSLASLSAVNDEERLAVGRCVRQRKDGLGDREERGRHRTGQDPEPLPLHVGRELQRLNVEREHHGAARLHGGGWVEYASRRAVRFNDPAKGPDRSGGDCAVGALEDEKLAANDATWLSQLSDGQLEKARSPIAAREHDRNHDSERNETASMDERNQRISVRLHDGGAAVVDLDGAR